jgi:hypothetical protein
MHTETFGVFISERQLFLPLDLTDSTHILQDPVLMPLPIGIPFSLNLLPNFHQMMEPSPSGLHCQGAGAVAPGIRNGLARTQVSSWGLTPCPVSQ